MVYDYSLIKSKWHGIWYPLHDLICINPKTKGKDRKRTIVHEGLHAYEELILEVENRFPDPEIELWAIRHLERDPLIANYMLQALLIVPDKFL